MKKIIFILLSGLFCLSLNAQFTETKEEAFVGAEDLLRNAIAQKYTDTAGYSYEIVKVSFTENAILITERTKGKEKGEKYGDAIENSYYKIPWSDISIFEFVQSPSNIKLIELRIHFKSQLSYKPGSETEIFTNTITLMVLGKDKDQMDKYIKSIQHFYEKKE
ncbi:MAG: hypothetical protein ABIQ40_02625 [Bacteroidia bacterium]